MKFKHMIFTLLMIFCFIYIFPTNSHAAEDLDSNCVLRLDFDNNITDTCAIPNHTTVNGYERYTDGVNGKAFLFDGASYIDLGNKETLQPENITISMWVRTSEVLEGEHMLFWCKEDGNFRGDGWYLSCLSEQVPLKLSVGAVIDGFPTEAYVDASRSDFFPINEWTHIAVTYNSSTKIATFYRNGELLRTLYVRSPRLAIKETVDRKFLGFNSPGYNNSYARLALDNVRIYSCEASKEQIATIYHTDFDPYEDNMHFHEILHNVLTGAAILAGVICLFFLCKFGYRKILKQISKEIIETSRKEGTIPLLNNHFTYLSVAILKLDLSGETPSAIPAISVKEQLSSYLNGFFSEVYGVDGECVVTPDKNQSFMIVFHSNERIEELFNDDTKRSQFDKMLRTVLHNEFMIGISDSTQEKGQLYEIYLQAASALDYSFLYGKNELILYEEVKNRTNAYESNASLVFDKMDHYISTLEKMDIRTILKDLHDNLLPECASLESYQAFRSDLTMQFEAIYLKYNSESLNDEIHIEDLIRSETYQEFEQNLASFLEHIKIANMKKLQEQLTEKTQNNDSIVPKVAAYIEEHFADSDLNVNQLGEIFHITPSYLSKQFKEFYNESVLDYLTNYRLERAKKLLTTTTLTVEQIAGEVGYLSSSVFIRMFKKALDTTPGSYRKEHTPH